MGLEWEEAAVPVWAAKTYLKSLGPQCPECSRGLSFYAIDYPKMVLEGPFL